MNPSKKSWQVLLKEAITDPNELFRLLKLDPRQLPGVLEAHHDFELKIPRRWLEKIKPSDPKDPLLLQILPTHREQGNHKNFFQDPLQESDKSPVPGLLHKYKSRVLLILSGICGVHCRYCFRRHFPYAAQQIHPKKQAAILNYLKEHRDINEVILSGGDPLLTSDRVLAAFHQKLVEIDHLKIIRIHTRLPVFLPERLDEYFMEWFTQSRLKPVMVVHINHPNEIDSALAEKMLQLKAAGVTLFNQTVLLKNVNDSAKILKTLSERLFFEAGIQPYYLHVLDKVKGAKHFDLSPSKRQSIYRELLSMLPGYLVPKLVTETPEAAFKVPEGMIT